MAQISTRQVSQMCQRLGTALTAGLDIRAAVDRESRYGSPVYRRHLTQVAEQVGRGATLAEALRACGSYFPRLTCDLAEVGEETGNLEGVLLRVADHYRHLLRLRRTFLLGILWPGIQLTLAVLIIGGLILVLDMLGAQVAVFGLSGKRGLLIYVLGVAGVACTLALVARGLLRGWFGPLPGALLYRVPVVGPSLQTMALARLCWTLSLALNAGIDAVRALRMALYSTQSRHYTRRLDEAEAVIVRGGQFHEALRRCDAFPDEFLMAMENAETTGTESESLTHLSAEYQRQAEAATLALAVAASVGIWILVAALLIYMIFRLFFTFYLQPMNEALEMLGAVPWRDSAP
jgi:type II secretory pathway component PulF